MDWLQFVMSLDSLDATDVETAFFPQDDTPGVPPTGATADYQTAVGQAQREPAVIGA